MSSRNTLFDLTDNIYGQIALSKFLLPSLAFCYVYGNKCHDENVIYSKFSVDKKP